MDFAQINTRKNADKGTPLHLTMIDSDELLYEDEAETKPIEIDLLGLESTQGRLVVTKMAKKAVKKNRKKRKLESMSVEQILTAVDKAETDKAELYSKLTTGWRNITYLEDDAPDDAEGRVLKFTPENARMLYETRPWIMEKIDAFLGDRANFLPESATD